MDGLNEGTGSSNSPTGGEAAVGLGNIAANTGGMPTFADLVAQEDAQKAADAANALTHGASVAASKQAAVTADTQGNQDAQTDDQLSEEIPQGQDFHKTLAWGKGWKETAQTKYKPAYDFISEKFGEDLSVAEIAADMYATIAGEEFKPEEVLKAFEELSPARAEQLRSYILGSHAEEAATKYLQEKLGIESLTDDDVEQYKLFKQAGGLEGLLAAENDDIPEALKYNQDGTRKSDEEIAFLQDIKRQTDQNAKARQTEQEQKRQAQMQADEARKEQAVQTYTAERLKVVDDFGKNLGLTVTDDERKNAPEIAETKDLLSHILQVGAVALYGQNEEAAKAYRQAQAHLRAGEPVLAERYKLKIEREMAKAVKQISEKVISPAIASLGLKPSGTTREEIPVKGRQQGIVGSDESLTPAQKIDRLIQQGILKDR